MLEAHLFTHSLFVFRYHSPIHRVLSPGSEITPTTPKTNTTNTEIIDAHQTPALSERYSMVFFYYPNYFSQITRNDQYTFNVVCSGELFCFVIVFLCCVVCCIDLYNVFVTMFLLNKLSFVVMQ
jgi:hypothetical protein